jgi:guanine deaminase
LTALGGLSKTYDCHIQTHLSESHDEVGFSRHLDAHHDLKDGVGRTDAEILESHNLLSDQCVLAHCVHMSTTDVDLLKARGSSVAHCPLSNFFFAGAPLRCKELHQRGNKVGLGTDVAGGYSPSMLDASRTAVLASHAVQQECHGASQPPAADHHVMDYRHAFYLATVGGAKALGLQNQIGNLRVGLEFDAMILSNDHNESRVQTFADDNLADVFQKLLVLGDDRNIKRVFVQGRDVTVRGTTDDASDDEPMR